LNRTQRRYTLINTDNSISSPETNTNQSEKVSYKPTDSKRSTINSKIYVSESENPNQTDLNENNKTNSKPGKDCIKKNISYILFFLFKKYI
jgi:hypothetical protein